MNISVRARAFVYDWKKENNANKLSVNLYATLSGLGSRKFKPVWIFWIDFWNKGLTFMCLVKTFSWFLKLYKVDFRRLTRGCRALDIIVHLKWGLWYYFEIIERKILWNIIVLVCKSLFNIIAHLAVRPMDL